MALEAYYDVIENMIMQGKTFEEMSNSLIANGLERGASVPNIKKFCSKYKLRKNAVVSDIQLECAVAEAVQETGPTYGRKMMTGYLASKGIHACEERVAAALHAVQPPYQEERRQGLRNLNPVPYNAAYFGQKLHLDQNEKMAMYGVTYVVAIDGFSGKIVGHSTMPVKNNVIIYDEVFRNAVLTFGLWDQLRVDHGGEFYLSLFIQQKLSHYRFNQERPPYQQTQSTRNHRIERMWPEVNNRVTYPLKAALVNLADQEVVDFEDMAMKHCISSLTCQVASIGLQRFVDAWNCHTVQGRGIPNVLAEGGCQVKIPVELLPGSTEAADLYQNEYGSNLTRVSTFGTSPFHTLEEQQNAEKLFNEKHPDLTHLFDCVVNRQAGPFQEAVMDIIAVSCRQ